MNESGLEDGVKIHYRMIFLSNKIVRFISRSIIMEIRYTIVLGTPSKVGVDLG